MADERPVAAETASARAVKLPQLERSDGAGKPAFTGHFELIKNVKVQVTVSLGTGELTVAELLALKEGAVVTLNQPSDAPLDIVLDGRVIGRGELVVVGDQFGVRVTEIGGAA